MELLQLSSQFFSVAQSFSISLEKLIRLQIVAMNLFIDCV